MNRSKPYSLTRSHWRSPSARRFSRLSTRNGSLAFSAQMRHPPDGSPGLRPRIAHPKTRLRSVRVPPYDCGIADVLSIANEHNTPAMCTLRTCRCKYGHPPDPLFSPAMQRQFGGPKIQLAGTVGLRRPRNRCTVNKGEMLGTCSLSTLLLLIWCLSPAVIAYFGKRPALSPTKSGLCERRRDDLRHLSTTR